MSWWQVEGHIVPHMPNFLRPFFRWLRLIPPAAEPVYEDGLRADASGTDLVEQIRQTEGR